MRELTVRRSRKKETAVYILIYIYMEASFLVFFFFFCLTEVWPWAFVLCVAGQQEGDIIAEFWCNAEFVP